MASARRAASTCSARASSLSMRPISLLTRLSAAANTCLRCRRCSAAPGELLGVPFPRAARRFSCAKVRSLSRIAQTLAQRLEIIKPSVVDFGMVTAQDDLMFVVAENAAFEFAGYGHWQSSRNLAALELPD